LFIGGLGIGGDEFVDGIRLCKLSSEGALPSGMVATTRAFFGMDVRPERDGGIC
jgi:hypothetical protein